MVVLTSFPPPTEGIKHEQQLTTVYVNNRELGKGTLYIAESRLAWVNGETQQGFSLEYPHIAMHAISRDLQAHPYECLYVMLDTCLEDEGQNESVSGDEGDDPGSGITEMHFVPEDKGMLDAMFQAMNHCQVLHPDPQDSFSEDDDQFEDADSEGEYVIGNGTAAISGSTEERQNGIRTIDEAMEVEDGQFEDADDDSLTDN
ncbi:chloride nucleotide-sensitive channel icln [Lycorma delicatula]|uniref:chloride nucleotide-sensitive channel icln n=1 Tax=Lycorma delicatula TaxID=130591 RepID=UPI003F5102C0